MNAYDHFDEDRDLRTRSFEISSREFSEINERLKQEVVNVQKQTDELTKLNDLMIGREIRMVELKHEMRELRRELAQLKSEPFVDEEAETAAPPAA